MPDVFELIQQFCPDGVEYKRLGDIGVFQNGKGISKSDLLDNGDIPVVHYGQIYTTYTHAFWKTVSFVDKRTAVSVKAHHGDVVVCLTDTADLGFVGKAVAQICGVDVGISGDAGVLHLNPTQVDARYLSYVMATECFQVQKEKCKRGTTVMHLNVPMWKKIRVPVPPLPVQEEIVRILDAFDIYCNDMTAGLAGELEMRRKQFQYWREKLLTFDNSVERKALGEVVSVSDGYPFMARTFSSDGYPVVRISDINDGSISVGDKFVECLPDKLKSCQILHGGEILVALSGSTGKAGYNTLDNVFVNQRIAIFRANMNAVSSEYLKYILIRPAFEKYCLNHGTGLQKNLSKQDLLSYTIPVPSFSVQQEIVRILDIFQELERELERELELRKKQFEYYRDRLLTFSEKEMS